MTKQVLNIPQTLCYTHGLMSNNNKALILHHKNKAKDVQESSASQEGDPTHPHGYISPMDYCIGLLYCVV
jgi:hypothetical protein